MLQESISLFLLGIATFLSPCSISLIAVYLTYSVGISKSIRRGLVIGCCFALAMSLVFFVLGYAICALIPITLISSRIFYGISGILLIVFGLNNIGVFKKLGLRTGIGSSLNERLNATKLSSLTRFSNYNYAIGSFLFGLIISIALGPCTLSIVLPAVLLTMFTAPTAFHGGFLLLVFGIGHALPVLFLSVLFATARQTASDKIAGAGKWVTKIFGVIFVLAGIAIIVYALGGW